MGWKIVGTLPKDIAKCVVVVAPHTSNLDFIIGRLGSYVLGIRARFLIKKEFFFFPFGPLLKAMGSIPVDRKNSQGITGFVSGLFNRYPSLYLLVTPEGTRKYNAHWKKGFYTIALRAGVPIAVGFLDYSKKEAGIGYVCMPSGDFQKDFKQMEDFYRTKTARYPADFNLSPQYQKKAP
jgi:1-acyl-sn-glycerol-3-phosphate acyltransferase